MYERKTIASAGAWLGSLVLKLILFLKIIHLIAFQGNILQDLFQEIENIFCQKCQNIYV